MLAYTGDTDLCDALTDLMTGADLVLADSAFVDGRDTATKAWRACAVVDPQRPAGVLAPGPRSRVPRVSIASAAHQCQVP